MVLYIMLEINFRVKSVFQHYLYVTAVTGCLFCTWVYIDTYFGHSDRLDVFAAELGNISSVHTVNGTGFCSVSFYVNDPVLVIRPEKLGSFDKEFIEQISEMSFFEGNRIIEPEPVETFENNSTTAVRTDKNLNYGASQVIESELADNQAEKSSQPMVSNQNDIKKDVLGDEIVEDEVVENENVVEPILETQEHNITGKQVEPDKPVDEVSDKLKETKKYTDSIEKRKKTGLYAISQRTH